MPDGTDNPQAPNPNRVEAIAQNVHALRTDVNRAMIEQTKVLTEISGKLSSMACRLSDVEQSQSNTAAALRGCADDNDDTGLVGEVKELRRWQKEWQSSSSWFGRSVLNALMTALIGGMIGALFIYVGLKK